MNRTTTKTTKSGGSEAGQEAPATVAARFQARKQDMNAKTLQVLEALGTAFLTGSIANPSAKCDAMRDRFEKALARIITDAKATQAESGNAHAALLAERDAAKELLLATQRAAIAVAEERDALRAVLVKWSARTAGGGK